LVNETVTLPSIWGAAGSIAAWTRVLRAQQHRRPGGARGGERHQQQREAASGHRHGWRQRAAAPISARTASSKRASRRDVGGVSLTSTIELELEKGRGVDHGTARDVDEVEADAELVGGERRCVPLGPLCHRRLKEVTWALGGARLRQRGGEPEREAINWTSACVGWSTWTTRPEMTRPASSPWLPGGGKHHAEGSAGE
jgi:hypothetical protein